MIVIDHTVRHTVLVLAFGVRTASGSSQGDFTDLKLGFKYVNLGPAEGRSNPSSPATIRHPLVWCFFVALKWYDIPNKFGMKTESHHIRRTDCRVTYESLP